MRVDLHAFTKSLILHNHDVHAAFPHGLQRCIGIATRRNWLTKSWRRTSDVLVRVTKTFRWRFAENNSAHSPPTWESEGSHTVAWYHAGASGLNYRTRTKGNYIVLFRWLTDSHCGQNATVDNMTSHVMVCIFVGPSDVIVRSLQLEICVFVLLILAHVFQGWCAGKCQI